jgi:hypothetical protein
VSLRLCLVSALAMSALQPSTSPRSGLAGVWQTQDVHFQSPSGNINCIVTRTFADCLVKHDRWPSHSPKPASCDVDWFPSEVSVARHVVRVGSCRGDIGPACLPHAGPPCRVLKYGQSVAPGQIRCTSSRLGVTCRRRDGARVGFRIARERYTLYR